MGRSLVTGNVWQPPSKGAHFLPSDPFTTYYEVEKATDKTDWRASEVFQRVKAPASKPEDLRSISETHTMKGENRSLQVNCPVAPAYTA